MDEKTKHTILSYNRFPDRFAERFDRFFLSHGKPFADAFLARLSGKHVLDLGAGSGIYGAYLEEHGCMVLCVDLSEEMVALCKKKGLEALVADMRTFEPGDVFNGVWAFASLLHLPKDELPGMVDRIYAMLADDGIAALAFKEGTEDGYEQKERYPGTKRWFTFYTDSEVLAPFEKKFTLIQKSRTVVSEKAVFLNYLFTKKHE